MSAPAGHSEKLRPLDGAPSHHLLLTIGVVPSLCSSQWLKASSECPLCPICKAGLSEDRIIPLYGRGRPQVDPRYAVPRVRTALQTGGRAPRAWHVYVAPCLSLALHRKVSLATDAGSEAVPARPTGHRPPPSPQRSSGAPSPRQEDAAARTEPLSSRVWQHVAAADAAHDGTYQGGALHGSATAVVPDLDGNANAALNAGLGLLSSFLGVQLVFPPAVGMQDIGGTSADLSPEQVQQAYLSRLLLLLGSFVILCLLLF